MNCLHANADAIVLMQMSERLVKGHNQRIDELPSKLAVSIRKKKDLREKDSLNVAQITTLETKTAKTQDREQCSTPEKYRDQCEETIGNLKETISLHEIATNNWTREHNAYKDRVALLETDLGAHFAFKSSIQTDPKPVTPAPYIAMEVEIQTDTVDAEVSVSAEPSCSPSSTPEERMASSSSAVVPPTPKPSTKHLAG
ncbi:hypothetical protein D9619_005178 [Psilocybe cf. subviscida]|uniref:Uncharacterized protein n=1 Tax=Psilocybe cf. subviscida TaxID=2480587 RepID=A0A8H5BYN3_9AGAR|nr:hypothetical protein D9619_005178 [Psilocybe cf. subviscida]